MTTATCTGLPSSWQSACATLRSREILISDLLARLVQPRIGESLEEVGPLELKGLPAPTLTHRVCYSEPGQSAEPEDPASRVGTGRSPATQLLPARLAETARRPFVGRAEEIERLRAGWRAACGGAPGVVTIEGEPGIGKSRLVGALAQIVADSGGSVLLGECEKDRQLVYQPWASALGRDMRESARAQLRRRIGDSGELARLVPGLRERLPELPEPVRVIPRVSVVGYLPLSLAISMFGPGSARCWWRSRTCIGLTSRPSICCAISTGSWSGSPF